MLRLGFRALCLISFLFSYVAWAIPVLRWDLVGKRDPEGQTEKYEEMLRQMDPVEGLRVLWWNVEGGNTNRRITAGECPQYRSHEPLEQNLVTMAHSSLKPDVIALGEYALETLAPWARRELGQLYRYSFYIPYSPGADSGIGGYSNIPLGENPAERLPFESGSTPAERQANREEWSRAFPPEVKLDRPYVRLDGRWNGLPFSLIPQHLLNPWRVRMNERALALPSWARARLLNKACVAALTAKDIYFDSGSPVLNQARALEAFLKRDFGPRMDASPFLVIGDLNSPTQSSVMRMLTRNLTDTFGPVTRNLPSAQPTFPTSCGGARGGIPALKIDHALASPGMNVRASRVLPIHGSDHYPAYVIVSPR